VTRLLRNLRLRAEPPTPGGVGLVAVALGTIVLWLAAQPPGQPTGRFLGELCGVEAVFLFSSTLVLATLLPAIERAFSGLDRVVVWHRRTATAGLLLLLPHWALATSAPDRYATGIGPAFGDVALIGLLVLSVWALAPSLRAARWPGPIRRLARTTYERWLTPHRLIGIFVAAAVAHGALVDPVLHRSPLLRTVYLVIGSLGVAAYLYRELLARFVVPTYDYSVAAVDRPNDATVVVSLEPTRTPLSFVPGQFVVLAFAGPTGWQRHPFSVASEPSDPRLEVAIKAVGDYTRQLRDALHPGDPAKIAGPFGGFDYRRGGKEQIWIAGGIGITPFISWMRSLNGDFDRDVTFWYSLAHDGDALYVDEIERAAAEHPTLVPHVVSSERDGFLTAEQTVAGRADLADVWVYMCGPPPMMNAFRDGFRRLGVPRAHLRWEQFAGR
jgi:predicted ferric reductase